MKLFFKLFLLFTTLLTVSFSEDTVKAKEIYLDYTSFPKRVFTGQKFDLTLKATILKSKENYENIILSYSDEEFITILNKEPKFIEEKENIFTTKLTFKTHNKEFKLPTITVALIKGEDIVDFLSIEPPSIRYEKIAVNQALFSNIIASDLQINTVKTKQYNNNTLLSTINIEAKHSNLEDINLSNYQEQGIKSFEENYPTQSIYYYVMFPSHKKQLNFTYYNTKQKDFVMINIPVNLEEDLVSTQTDLNPYNSSMLIYKQGVVIFFLLLFLILFFIKKKNIYLAFVVVFIFIITYLFIPNKKVVIYEGTNVYILPVKSSTIYKTLDQRELVEVINNKGKFSKVLFENQNIGWIKTDDIK